MGGRFRQWFGFFIMLIGLGVLCSPFVVGAYREQVQLNVVSQFHSGALVSQTPVQVIAPKEITTAPTQSIIPTEETAAPTETAALPIETPAPTEAATTVPTEPVTVPKAEPLPTDPTTAPVEEPLPTEPETFPEETTLPTEPAAIPTETETTVPAQTEPVNPPAQSGPADWFYQAALAYNDRMFRGGQAQMNAIEDVESFELDARNYGYSENIVGTIRIPRLDVELGLYLGANRDNMAKGAALFGMTSIPLGLPNENAAIAGHRGWSGTAMFRDIQMIKIGDPIYITTPWAQLQYRVCAIEIVTPDNNNWCKIHWGRTLITLMTCHPYGQRTHRYVVYAELVTPPNTAEDIGSTAGLLAQLVASIHVVKAPETVPATEPVPETVPVTEPITEPIPETVPTTESEIEMIPAAEPTAAPEKSEPVTPILAAITQRPIEPQSLSVWTGETAPAVQEDEATVVTIVNPDGSREDTLVDASPIAPDGREYGAVLSNVVIMAENKMRIVACVMAVLVGLVGIWLTAQTIGDIRRKRGEKNHESE